MCCVMAASLIFGSSRFLKLSLWLRQSATVHPVCSATTSHDSSAVPASCACRMHCISGVYACSVWRTSEGATGLVGAGALAFNLEAGCSVKTLVPGGSGILVLLLPLSMVFCYRCWFAVCQDGRWPLVRVDDECRLMMIVNTEHLYGDRNESVVASGEDPLIGWLWTSTAATLLLRCKHNSELSSNSVQRLYVTETTPSHTSARHQTPRRAPLVARLRGATDQAGDLSRYRCHQTQQAQP